MYLPNNSKTPPMYYITSTTNPFINSVKMHTNLKADFSNYIYFFLHPIFFSSKKAPHQLPTCYDFDLKYVGNDFSIS